MQEHNPHGARCLDETRRNVEPDRARPRHTDLRDGFVAHANNQSLRRLCRRSGHNVQIQFEDQIMSWSRVVQPQLATLADHPAAARFIARPTVTEIVGFITFFAECQAQEAAPGCLSCGVV